MPNVRIARRDEFESIASFYDEMVDDMKHSAFDPLWTYNLDGGPSIALYYRLSPDDDWVRVAGGTSKDADIMAFAD